MDDPTNGRIARTTGGLPAGPPTSQGAPAAHSRGPTPAVPAAPGAAGWPPRRVLRLSFTAGIGVVLAWVGQHAIGSVAGELILLTLALVVAVGLDPIVAWLQRRGLRRGRASRS